MIENELTDLSRQMYRDAVSGYLTLSEATKRLKTCAQIRTVGDILAERAGIPLERKAELTQYLVQILADTDPKAHKDSIARKVRMWLNNETRKISKQGAIQMAFALKLSFTEANDLLVQLSEEGFHWRDPEELAYIFALQNGISYPQALALCKELREENLIVPDDAQKEQGRGDRELLYTADVEYEVRSIRTVEELKQYILAHREKLGKFHNTAYSIFVELMDLLIHPDKGNVIQLENVPVKDIVGSNLYADLLPGIRQSGKSEVSSDSDILLNALQKSILENWPDETILSKMLNRKTDVNRKTLILLFLATDGGTSAYGDWREADQSEEEIFEERYERMKDMLIDCGFAPLDPRVSFDWMILYCMCAGDACSIDEQIQEFLQTLFLT